MSAHLADAPPGFSLDLTKVDRETALRTWLVYHGLACSDLAVKLGVNPSTVSRIIKGERRSPATLKQLRALGIPGVLLPRIRS